MDEEEVEEEYIVENITDWRYDAQFQRKEFLIKWKGYSEQTWEPEENLHCPHILEQFENNLPEKERMYFNYENPEGLTGFQRKATFEKCLGADGPVDANDEEPFHCLIKFTDSQYAEEVSLLEFFENKPEEAFKFCEQRLIYKS